MSDKRYVVKEQSLKNLADAIREKTGTVASYDIDEMPAVLESIGMPEREELYTEQNGEFIPATYGYSKVTVDVQPEREEINITENGEYTPSTYGYSKVSVNIPDPPLEEITITQAGTYTPTKYGFSKVVADVPSRNFEEEVF